MSIKLFGVKNIVGIGQKKNINIVVIGLLNHSNIQHHVLFLIPWKLKKFEVV
ncbi:hypothetical protein LbFV_ORF45 [Leptopilina boulardi filamentous virus]|uniref:Uncharacterized protein n=1 Tax=Leptopilina boulardi filamentous virus TaxID=552509 RepID=A0A1S5YD95_9VIRU|nr:hypothetical protein LbFV_ORF45 [Leptopilina boulardi filamentous virus]AQQ79965.1 hypothetical protein LbFV_ORF45 [Leptopilina boulardi filamentous virus]